MKHKKNIQNIPEGQEAQTGPKHTKVTIEKFSPELPSKVTSVNPEELKGSKLWEFTSKEHYTEVEIEVKPKSSPSNTTIEIIIE